MEETDKSRARFVSLQVCGEIDDPGGYHLVINTDNLPDALIVRLIGDALERSGLHRAEELHPRLFTETIVDQEGIVLSGEKCFETFRVVRCPVQHVAGAGDFAEKITVQDVLVFIVIDEEQPDRRCLSRFCHQ